VSAVVAVQPVAVKRETAAEMLGMSLSHFERYVQHEVKIVRSGKLRLVPVSELQAWAENRAHALLAGE
jgi:excisionase family DNA binding protein